MRILTVIGARPQFVKAAVLSRAFLDGGVVHETIIHTGQHFDDNMSRIFFEELGVPKPNRNLGIAGSGHGEMTGRMMEQLEVIFQADKPQAVLVYGDTNSTLAASLVASKLCVPVLHVEAGLRSFNRRMPEEINRVVTDHLSSVLFSPTPLASKNLRNEGIDASTIHEVGDVMYDAANLFLEIAKIVSNIHERLLLWNRDYVLATIHRQENTDDEAKLRNICVELTRASKSIPIVLPLHPRTRRKIHDLGDATLLNGVTVIEPVGYLDMIQLERGASVIVTDSGGVQKEAYFWRVPCITLRDETEWVELVETGWNELASPLSNDVGELIIRRIGSRGEDVNLYGGGLATDRINEILSGLLL